MTTIAAPPTSRPPRYRFTVADFYAMADVGILAENDRVELLDGDIIAMPPIGDWHAASVDLFNNLLSPLQQGRAIVRVQGPTRLNEISEPLPDVMLLRWRDDFYRGGHPSPGDVELLIEVSDTTVDYDRNVKLSAYARAGIREVWIVTRQDQRIEAYTEPTDDGYSSVRYVGRGESIAPVSFPDVRVQVDSVITE